jgi:hypothetical protein
MVERIKCGMVNCWLVRDAGGSGLVDTEVLKYREKIYEAVKDSDVKLILLTHGAHRPYRQRGLPVQRLGAPIAMNEAIWR